MAWASVLVAYMLGCIPFGIIVARVKGVDLRASGSGNTGATNALRVMGKGAGLITLAGDMLKGAAGVYIAYRVAGLDSGIPFISAAAAVLGHDFPVFQGFKGGKGVATSFGVFLILAPYVALAGLGVWIITVLIFRISSLGALASFAIMPVLVLLMKKGDMSLFALSVFLTAMIVIKHRANIARLLRGDEPRIGRSVSANS